MKGYDELDPTEQAEVRARWRAELDRLAESAFPNEKTLLRIAEALDADISLVARSAR